MGDHEEVDEKMVNVLDIEMSDKTPQAEKSGVAFSPDKEHPFEYTNSFSMPAGLIDHGTIHNRVRKNQLKGFSVSDVPFSWRNLSLVTDRIKFHNVSGYVLPKEMLCVLGGPGSGVLDLLQVLTRRQVHSGNIQVYGEILVNGNFPGEKFKRVVSYIPKTENHLARLKVRETLEFSARIRAPAHMTEAQIQDNVDTALKWMDMTDPKIQETYVGDATLKGISGGQKRRLSFGVEAVSGYSVLVADLPTNGLDAKTAYTVVESAKRVAMAGKSMIMSVVQPSPELFDLFDNVLVLSYGEMIYFGPQEHIEEYFQSLGFERPSTKSLPAWIEEITVNPKKYHPDEDFESNTALCDMMVQNYQTSDFCQELGKKLWEQTIASRPPKHDLFDGQNDSPTSNSVSFDVTYDKKLQAAGQLFVLPKGISWCQKIGYCFKRQITIQMRDTQSLIYRALQALIISIFLGIIFFGLDPVKDAKYVRSRIGFCFFAVGFMGFGAVPFIPGLANVRSVFYYQRDAQYFPTTAYYLALILSELPFTAIETLLFCSPCYFMSSMRPDLSFLYWYYICFCVRFISWSVCMLFVGIFPSAATAQVFATGFLPVCFAFNGFLVPSQAIPVGIKWLHWLSFFTPAFKGIVSNELGYIIDHKEDAYKHQNQWLELYSIIDKDMIWISGIILWIWFFAFNGLAVIAFHNLNFDNSDVNLWQSIKKKFGFKVKLDLSFFLRKNSLNDLSLSIVPEKHFPNNAPEVTIEWHNLNYTVQLPSGENRLLLSNVNGFVKPGEVVALMGPSGAGKSTLLDILADKKNTGVIEGTVLINGKTKDKFFNRYMGYVEQFDSHLDTFTVKEAIEFSANLRLPSSYTDAHKEYIIEKVIADLNIQSICDSYTRDISQEERKKATIAVELVSEPGLLFLDEPTTGLDSGAALNVMETVQKLAKDNNLTVLCTIHQPSANVYSLFDKIVLLKSNPGAVAFFGKCEDLNNFYEVNDFGRSPEGKNPADWAIEALDNHDDPGLIWMNTLERTNILREIDEGVCPNPPEPIYDTVYATNFCTQFQILFIRGSKMFSRDIAGVIARYLIAFVLSLIFGFLYFDFKSSSSNQVKYIVGEVDGKPITMTLGKVMGTSILFLTIVYATESAAQEIPAMVLERPMVYREIDSKLYGFGAYYLSRFFSQLPHLFIQTLIFSSGIYFLSYTETSNAETFFQYLLCFFLILTTSTTLSQFFAVATPTDGVGNVLYTGYCTLSRMMCGFLTYVSVMPSWTRIFNTMDFFKYPIFFLASILNPEIMPKLEEDQIPKFQTTASDPNNGVTPYVYLIGLLLFYILVHMASILILNFKRWDSR